MYFAYETVVEKQKAIIFIPMTSSCSMARGVYNPAVRKLFLQSKDISNVLKFVKKVNEFGEEVIQKGKQVVERRTIEEPIQFALEGESIREWINLNVENVGYAESKIEEYELTNRAPETGDQQPVSEEVSEQTISAVEARHNV